MYHFNRIFDYVDAHARTHGNAEALIIHDSSERVSWYDLSLASSAFAANLLASGVKKGDVVCTQLPCLREHIFLFVGCLRIGAIFCPLDLRLRGEELRNAVSAIKPKAFFFLGFLLQKVFLLIAQGKTEVFDFRPTIESLIDDLSGCCSCWVQFQKEEELIIKHPLVNVVSAGTWASRIKWTYIWKWATLQLWWASWWITGFEPAIIVGLVISFF